MMPDTRKGLDWKPAVDHDDPDAWTTDVRCPYPGNVFRVYVWPKRDVDRWCLDVRFQPNLPTLGRGQMLKFTYDEFSVHGAQAALEEAEHMIAGMFEGLLRSVVPAGTGDGRSGHFPSVGRVDIRDQQLTVAAQLYARLLDVLRPYVYSCVDPAEIEALVEDHVKMYLRDCGIPEGRFVAGLEWWPSRLDPRELDITILWRK